MNVANTFIITSVIHFKNRKLSYSSVRSLINSEQRSVQTLETIKSIRSKVPNATIILVEMGIDKKIDPAIINSIDKFIYIGNHILVKWAVSSKHKGLGEAMGLLFASKKFDINTRMFFKISGRYFLNDQFDIKQWIGKYFFFKFYSSAVSTRLYGFDSSLFKIWKKALRKSLVKLYCGKSIEEIFPNYIDSYFIKEIHLLGVTGMIAPTGEVISE